MPSDGIQRTSTDHIFQRGIGSPMDGFDPEFADEKAHPWKSWISRVRYSQLRLSESLIAKNLTLIRCRLGTRPSHRASVTMSSVRIVSLSLTYIDFYSVFTGPYKWLAHNCVLSFNRERALQTYGRTDKDGDKICIFGFSRGAYTARVCVPPPSKNLISDDIMNFL